MSIIAPYIKILSPVSKSEIERLLKRALNVSKKNHLLKERRLLPSSVREYEVDNALTL